MYNKADIYVLFLVNVKVISTGD